MKKPYIAPEVLVKQMDLRDILTSSIDPEDGARNGDNNGAGDDPNWNAGG